MFSWRGFCCSENTALLAGGNRRREGGEGLSTQLFKQNPKNRPDPHFFLHWLHPVTALSASVLPLPHGFHLVKVAASQLDPMATPTTSLHPDSGLPEPISAHLSERAFNNANKRTPLSGFRLASAPQCSQNRAYTPAQAPKPPEPAALAPALIPVPGLTCQVCGALSRFKACALAMPSVGLLTRWSLQLPEVSAFQSPALRRDPGPPRTP